MTMGKDLPWLTCLCRVDYGSVVVGSRRRCWLVPLAPLLFPFSFVWPVISLVAQ